MKIIEGVSHLDHGLTDEQREFIVAYFSARTEFFIETIELPPSLGIVACNLHGPATGGAPVPEAHVHYGIRGARRHASRLIGFDEPTPSLATRLVTVIAGPVLSVPKIPEEAGESVLATSEPCVLYTAYGGPQAPREPGDAAIASWDELLESRAFWAQHALRAE